MYVVGPMVIILVRRVLVYYIFSLSSLAVAKECKRYSAALLESGGSWSKGSMHNTKMIRNNQ